MGRLKKGPIYNVEGIVVRALIDRWYGHPHFYSFPSDPCRVLRCYKNTMRLMSASSGPDHAEPLDVDPEIFRHCSGAPYSKTAMQAFWCNKVFPVIPDQMDFLTRVVGLPVIESYMKQELLHSSAWFYPEFPDITIVRQTKNKLFWFDGDWILQVSDYTVGPNQMKTFTCSILGTKNWPPSSKLLPIGSSFSDCLQIFLKQERKQPGTGYSDLERFAQKVLFSFGRAPENTAANTFDWIRAEVSIGHYLGDFNTTFSEVKRRKDEIQQMVLEELMDSKRFQKYGVPINFLKLSDVTFTRAYTLEFIFELKDFDWASTKKES